MTTLNPAREEILGKVRMALLRPIDATAPPVPSSARVTPRTPGEASAEIEMLLGEIGKHDSYFVLVTGPNRTTDIELTVTMGVHGPQALHVWAMEG